METFNEDLNVAVITTKYIFKNGMPILHAYHHDDGFWEFVGDQKIEDEKEYMLVALEEILEIDSSLHYLAALLPGMGAHRKSKNDEWAISVNRNEDD